ncbi:MAG: alpha/beta hydrolase [Actinobacteria bacterium]|nr:alpha/beta hydrolase [Actinomycetota bacterium]
MATRRNRTTRATLGALVALAVTALVSACMPAEGRYSSVQHPVSELTTVADRVYGQAEDYAGTVVPLKLDLFLPPAGGPATRPTVVLVHGGSFSGGDKSNMAGTARGYAQRGYVAVALGYRLDPNAAESTQRYLAAATDAIDDGLEAVRWLRANATTYRIDPERIAVIGSSAGGAVALGTAIADDPTPGGPLAAWSPRSDAAVSTGAHLTPGIDLGFVTFEPTDSPVLMFHYDVDTATGNDAAYARRTCDGLTDAGVYCRFVQQPGSGHTVDLNAGGPWWTDEIGPFLWDQLDIPNA